MTPLAAQAQAPQQPPSAVERALSNRIVSEVSANVQASAKIIQLEDDLATARARIKELEAAKEPPK